MKLKFITLSEVLHDTDVKDITAQTNDGSFSVLEGHENMLALIAPGILWIGLAGNERLIYAVDSGLLTKTGDIVTISVRHAIKGTSAEQLGLEVQQHYKTLSEQEKRSGTALSELAVKLSRKGVLI